MTTCRWLAAALFLLCRAGLVRAQDVDASMPRPLVSAVKFVCVAPIDTLGLSRLIPVKIGEPFRQEDLAEAKRLLELTELFTSISVSSATVPEGVAVEIALTREVVVNAIRFRGVESFNTTELRRVTRLQEGSTFTEALRDYGLQRLREYYAEQGFPDAQIEVSVDKLAIGEVDVIFEVSEGEALTIESLEFVGDVPVGHDELKKVLPFNEGSRYGKVEAKAAEKTLRRFLRQQDYYEAEVETDWELSGPHRGRLRYQVDAGPRFALHFNGNSYFGDAALLELLDILDRPIVTDGTWRELARRARRAYQAAGFHEAKVTARVEAGDPRAVNFDIVEGSMRHVGAVRFEGNRGLSQPQLDSVMATRPPSWVPWNVGVLVDEVLSDDLKRLWFFYRRFGFMDAQIVDSRIEIEEATGTLQVTVVIEEGPQTRVATVERIGFSGVDGLPLDALPLLSTAVGNPFDPDIVEADRRALVSALFKAGYATAQADAQVTYAADARRSADAGAGGLPAAVQFVAVPGERQRIGTIIIQNNIDTQGRVVTRELPFKTGEPLNPDALLLGQSRLYALGLFRTVTVRPLGEAKGGEREIGISVSERFPGTMQWGAGYNTRDGLRGFAEVGYSNLQGLARRISLRGDFNFDPGNSQPNEYLGNLGYLDPRFFDSRWTLRANFLGQRSTRSVDQFSIERIAFVPAIERLLFSGLTAGFDALIEQARVFDVARDVLTFNPRDEGDLQTIGGGPFLVYDGRDDPFMPTSGISDSLRIRIAPGELGSDIPFFKVVAQHSQFLPISEAVTFVYAARVGWASTLRSGDVLPIRERFFLGGRTTVRGFKENDIGPLGAVTYDELGNVVDQGKSPLGGDLVMSLTTEMRFPLLLGVSGAVFVDAGAVYLQERPIRVNDIRRSAGPGLRYATPIGPISLDYGIKLDRRSGESAGEIHFSIGTIF